MSVNDAWRKLYGKKNEWTAMVRIIVTKHQQL